MNLLTSVLAHTGRDEIEHGIETADIVIGLIFITLILVSIFLIKRKKKK